MPIDTVNVNAKIHYNDNTPAEGVTVRALLSSPSQNTTEGYIVKTPVESVVDATGCVSLELWPNENGDSGTFYIIEAIDCKLEELLNVVAVVPISAVDLDLEDIALPINTLSLENSSGNVPNIRQITTSEGIIGGGDLTQNREHKLDLSTISTELVSPLLTDIIPIQDPAQPDSVRYARVGSLPGLNYPVQEQSFATAGQLIVPITESFNPGTGQIQVSINGRDVYNGDWVETAGQIELSVPGGLEGGEEILVTVLKSASLGTGGAIDAGDVSYNAGTVESALNDLFATTGANPWVTITGDTLAVSGDRLFVDPTAMPITITLPVSPTSGTSVKITDISQASNIVGSSITNTITVDRNGELIMDVASDLIIDQAFASVELVYLNAIRGWRLLE